jgi:hypothetical protein
VAHGDILDLYDIPFLDREQLDGRFVGSMLFFDGDWHAFMEFENERQVIWTTAWPAEATYYGTRPESPTDLSTAFLQLLGQHANFPAVQRHFGAILDHIYSLGASLYKLEVLHAGKHPGSARLATTEIEYLLTVCRSMFDHLQEILAKLWDYVRLTEETTKKQGLPASFRKMVLAEGRRQTPEELSARYGLPLAIADVYVRHAEMFLQIRKFRDQIIHGGRPNDIIFRGEGCYQVQRRLGPFRDLDIWEDAEVEPNEIVPLMPILAQIIHGTFLACEDFAHCWSARIILPAASVPNMQLFVRGYFNEHLIAALTDAEDRLGRGRSIVSKVPKAPAEPA